uniref:IncF plasmid conjugative transfer protein TrbC n=1 Tax=Vibrio sp. F12 FF_152 TaxID=1652829 RepID=A0A0H3ZVT8_9VIBR|nr:IncF plasmid conjugative transfer protein TrbC [Vibrio sp. F12 FF_152]
MKITILLLTLWSTYSFASIGYTEEELKSLSNLELNAKEQGIDSTSQHAIQTQQAKSIQFQEQIRADAAHWQEKLDPRYLKGAVDIPQPTENPNAAPTGMMIFVSLTMPKPALKALLKQSEAWQVPLVIRGVLPQGFAATAKKSNHLSKSQVNHRFKAALRFHRNGLERSMLRKYQHLLSLNQVNVFLNNLALKAIMIE